MRGYKAILLATVAAMISTSALATDDDDDDRKVLKVTNTLDELFIQEDIDTITVEVIPDVNTKFEIDQINRGDIAATTRVWASNVDGYEATAVAIVNNASVDVKGNVGGSNWQGNWGDVSSTLNADLQNVTGKIELTSVAIANNFSLNVESYGEAVFSSSQFNDGDVSAHLTANLTGQINDVTTTAVAIANNASVQIPHGGTLIGGVEQVNNGNVTAFNSTTLRPVMRAVDPATSVAFGNNASFTNYVPKVQ